MDDKTIEQHLNNLEDPRLTEMRESFENISTAYDLLRDVVAQLARSGHLPDEPGPVVLAAIKKYERFCKSQALDTVEEYSFE